MAKDWPHFLMSMPDSRKTSLRNAARFYDGRSARVHEVFPVIETNGLVRLIDQTGHTLALWMAGQMTRQSSGDRKNWVFTYAGSDGRLVIRDPELKTQLRHVAPHLVRSIQYVYTFRIVAVSTAVLAMLGLFLWQGLPLFSNRIAAAIPPQIERKLGARMRQTIVESLALPLEEAHCSQSVDANCPKPPSRLCTRAEGQAVLKRLTAKMTDDIDFPWPLSFEIIDKPISNAFALPGGYVFIFRGLIEETKDPAVLAGILAHEIGHVRGQHGLQSLIRNSGTWFLIGLVTGDLTGAVAIIITAVVNRAYSRDMERDADRDALKIMRRLKIDPRPLAKWFDETNEKGSPDNLVSLFLTHPPVKERSQFLRAAKIPDPVPIMSAADWAALKKICPPKKTKKPKNPESKKSPKHPDS